jgi:hypothetical protein
MKNLTIVFMAAAALASFGCKKKGGAGDAMAKMSEFKDKMCACKDKKCADEVQDAMNKWSAENAKSAGDKKPEAPDEKTMKEMQEVGTKYGECMAKAMSGGDTATAGSDATKPAEPVAAGGDCNLKPKDGAFCLTGPATLKGSDPYDKDDSSKRYDYADDKGGGVTVVVTKLEEASDWDSEVRMMTEQGAKKKDMKQEDLADGGKFWSWTDDDGEWVTVLVKKDLMQYFCRTHAKPTADAAMVATCKSLKPL